MLNLPRYRVQRTKTEFDEKNKIKPKTNTKLINLRMITQLT